MPFMIGFCLLQNWGGGDFVSSFKLWSRVAISFNAPSTMTNRSSKMAKLWRDHDFDALVGPQAAAAGVEQPPQNQGQPKKRVHSIAQTWPGCLHMLPEKRQRGAGDEPAGTRSEHVAVQRTCKSDNSNITCVASRKQAARECTIQAQGLLCIRRNGSSDQ